MVGGGPGPAMDHPALHHGGHADPGRHGRRAGGRVVGATVQRGHHLPLRVRRLVGPEGGRGRRHPGDQHHRGRPPAGRAWCRRRRPHRPTRRRRHRQGGHRLRRRQLVPGQGGRPVRQLLERALHPRGQGGAHPRPGRDRPTVRAGRPAGRRHRDDRRHPGHTGRRLPLHEPRHGGRRRGGRCRRAGKGQGPPRGAHRGRQGAPGHRPVAARRRAPRVQRPPDSRGRVRLDAPARHRRHAGGGRCRRVLPGGRPLPRRRQLRHRIGPGGRRDGHRRHRAAATPPHRDCPTTGAR